MKNLKTALTLFLTSLLTSNAFAVLNISLSGGQSTPLTVEFLNNDSFDAIATPKSQGTVIFLIFNDIWDNSVVSNSSSGQAPVTASVDGSSSLWGIGAYDVFPFAQTDDLIIGFTPSQVASGDSVSIGAGSVASSNVLNLNYTALADSGTLTIYDGFNDKLGADSSYTVSAVPEPSSVAFAIGAVAGLAALRSRRRGA